MVISLLSDDFRFVVLQLSVALKEFLNQSHNIRAPLVEYAFRHLLFVVYDYAEASLEQSVKGWIQVDI